jgi:enoyl-CoA hydratase
VGLICLSLSRSLSSGHLNTLALTPVCFYRHMFMWDLAKPVIAQVHGYCLAGGTELATACDLVYVADDAKIGYPPTRSISPPDMQWQPWMLGFREGMYYMLTGDDMSGTRAAELGFANAAVPESELVAMVLDVAQRVAIVPSDLQMINKRSVHRQMEAMGIRNGLRAGTELQALATYTRTTRDWMGEIAKGG